jgi:intein-encoded DNA endonuclease-like protein
MRDDIIKDYLCGISTTSLSKKYSVHRTTIQRILKRANIGLRKRTAVYYSRDFFSCFSKDSAYWAGFILADGHIRKDRNTVAIHLAIKDLQHLEKISAATDYAGKIEKYPGSCRINFNGKWIKEDLNKIYKIDENKSYKDFSIKHIPKKYWPSFIRGFFDGDGSVSCGRVLQLNFVGRESFLSELANIFYDIGVRLKSKNRTPPIQNNSGIKGLHYSGKNAMKILNWLYKCSDDKNRLSRKYLLYKGLL